MAYSLVCALCGTSDSLVVGSTGCVCRACVGEAVKSAICATDERSDWQRATASDRCLMCGEAITTGNLVATRGPYRLCQGCLFHITKEALNPDDFKVIAF